MPMRFRRVAMLSARSCTYLLHDTSLALGEGDVTTRLVLDELDFDLPALATWLVVVVVIVVGGAGARTLDAASLAIAILELVVVVVGVGWILRHNLGRHLEVVDLGFNARALTAFVLRPSSLDLSVETTTKAGVPAASCAKQ